jgi:hypothetical protein
MRKWALLGLGIFFSVLLAASKAQGSTFVRVSRHSPHSLKAHRHMQLPCCMHGTRKKGASNNSPRQEEKKQQGKNTEAARRAHLSAVAVISVCCVRLILLFRYGLFELYACSYIYENNTSNQINQSLN